MNRKLKDFVSVKFEELHFQFSKKNSHSTFFFLSNERTKTLQQVM